MKEPTQGRPGLPASRVEPACGMRQVSWPLSGTPESREWAVRRNGALFQRADTHPRLASLRAEAARQAALGMSPRTCLANSVQQQTAGRAAEFDRRQIGVLDQPLDGVVPGIDVVIHQEPAGPVFDARSVNVVAGIDAGDLAGARIRGTCCWSSNGKKRYRAGGRGRYRSRSGKTAASSDRILQTRP